MKVFGSDGFRSEFGKKYMTEEFLFKFSDSFAQFCQESNDPKKVVIGFDTRSSGEIIDRQISTILSENGIEVTSVGVISTPGLSHITKENNFSYGIMITASHNPASDNGIKIFSGSGFKLDSHSEQTIEKYINGDKKTAKSFDTKNIVSGKKLVNHYVNYLKSKKDFPELKKRYLIDCSNGSNSDICNQLFSDNDNIKMIYNEPDGQNINFECGALEDKNLYEKTVENYCDYGISFDGDGDRAIFCHKNYGVIETEKILALFADMFKGNGKKTVVCTEISNMGLKENLSEIDLELIETELGDRIVVNKTLETNSILGAETSGHYFFPEESTTMDGLLAFFNFLKLSESNINLVKKLEKMKNYNVFKKNIPITKRFDLTNISNLVNGKINVNEKIIIRESMWDLVIRFYYQYDKIDRSSFFINELKRYIGKNNYGRK